MQIVPSHRQRSRTFTRIFCWSGDVEVLTTRSPHIVVDLAKKNMIVQIKGIDPVLVYYLLLQIDEYEGALMLSCCGVFVVLKWESGRIQIWIICKQKCRCPAVVGQVLLGSYIASSKELTPINTCLSYIRYFFSFNRNYIFLFQVTCAFLVLILLPDLPLQYPSIFLDCLFHFSK